MQKHVVELEVVVHERLTALGLDVVLEPRDDTQDPASRLLVVGEVRALRPTGDLTREEPLRTAERIEIGGSGVHTVQAGEHVHEVRRDSRGLIGPADQGRRKLGPDRDSGAVLHEEEGCAQDGRILAQMKSARRQGEFAPESREHPVLADHVVRAGRQGSRRRPAQDAGLAVHFQEVVEVGEAGRELARRPVQGEPVPTGIEMSGEARPVLDDGFGAEGHVQGYFTTTV